MTGKKVSKLKICIIAVAAAAAIFAVLYYSGVFLPSYTVWKEYVIEGFDEGPDRIELKKRKVSVYKDGEVIFTSPAHCAVSDMIYTDIDRDGEDELILLDYALKKFGKARPFWIKFDPPIWRQHIYIYDYIEDEKSFRPIWMASDIGMKASDFELINKDVIRIRDSEGNTTDWMWISFGLRCVDLTM